MKSILLITLAVIIICACGFAIINLAVIHQNKAWVVGHLCEFHREHMTDEFCLENARLAYGERR